MDVETFEVSATSGARVEGKVLGIEAVDCRLEAVAAAVVALVVVGWAERVSVAWCSARFPVPTVAQRSERRPVC